jgi:hypothetical protein
MGSWQIYKLETSPVGEILVTLEIQVAVEVLVMLGDSLLRLEKFMEDSFRSRGPF